MQYLGLIEFMRLPAGTIFLGARSRAYIMLGEEAPSLVGRMAIDVDLQEPVQVRYVDMMYRVISHG